MVKLYTKEFAKKFKSPNISKEYILKPQILKLCGNVKGKKIIDLGCGSGYFTILLAKRGGKCTGIDISKNQLNEAIKNKNSSRLGVKYLLRDVSNLKKFRSNYFDIALMINVTNEMNRLSKIKKTFKAVSRILKRNGHLILAFIHPSAPYFGFKNIKPQKKLFYFKSGAVQYVKAKLLKTKLLNDKGLTFTDFHYTLEDYSNALKSAGFFIEDIKEPRPTSAALVKAPYLRYRSKEPIEILIKAVKIV